MFLAQGGRHLSGSVGATDWEGAATAGIFPCLEGAESWLCFPKGFSVVSSSPACPWGTSHPLASEACGEGGRPSPSSLLWGSRAQAATPIVVAQKAGLDSGPRPPRAERVPTLEDTLSLRHSGSVTSGKASGQFSEWPCQLLSRAGWKGGRADRQPQTPTSWA